MQLDLIRGCKQKNYDRTRVSLLSGDEKMRGTVLISASLLTIASAATCQKTAGANCEVLCANGATFDLTPLKKRDMAYYVKDFDTVEGLSDAKASNYTYIFNICGDVKNVRRCLRRDARALTRVCGSGPNCRARSGRARFLLPCALPSLTARLAVAHAHTRSLPSPPVASSRSTDPRRGAERSVRGVPGDEGNAADWRAD